MPPSHYCKFQPTETRSPSPGTALAGNAGIADLAALDADITALEAQATALGAAIEAELALAPPVPEPMAALAERIMPLSYKDLPERKLRLERLRRRAIRLERESRALREQGAALLERSRDLAARRKADLAHSADALLALSALRADHNRRVLEWANRLIEHQRRRADRS